MDKLVIIGLFKDEIIIENFNIIKIEEGMIYIEDNEIEDIEFEGETFIFEDDINQIITATNGTSNSFKIMLINPSKGPP